MAVIAASNPVARGCGPDTGFQGWLRLQTPRSDDIGRLAKRERLAVLNDAELQELVHRAIAEWAAKHLDRLTSKCVGRLRRYRPRFAGCLESSGYPSCPASSVHQALSHFCAPASWQGAQRDENGPANKPSIVALLSLLVWLQTVAGVMRPNWAQARQRGSSATAQFLCGASAVCC